MKFKEGDRVRLVSAFRCQGDTLHTDNGLNDRLRQVSSHGPDVVIGTVLGKRSSRFETVVSVAFDSTQHEKGLDLYVDEEVLELEVAPATNEEVDAAINSILNVRPDLSPRVIRDGKVAVIVSPGFGAGWSTWTDEPKVSVFAPDVVAWIEAGKPLVDLDDTFGHYGYTGGLRDAEIQWLPVGTRFQIDEYDGSEQLVVLSPDYGHIA